MQMPQYSPESSSDDKCATRKPNFSGEEVVNLASKNPKKRAGRKKFRETRHPVYRGVRQKSSGKWVCEVRQPNHKPRIWLGTFATAEMAARAHDVAAIALRGRSACLNFADSAWLLPVPKSLEANDIRKAAVKAAEDYPPLSIPEVEATWPALEKMWVMDEEAMLEDMHGLLVDMAEGLMMPPPWYINDDVEEDADLALWNYSI